MFSWKIKFIDDICQDKQKTPMIELTDQKTKHKPKKAHFVEPEV